MEERVYMHRMRGNAVREMFSGTHSQDILNSLDGFWVKMGCACLHWQMSCTDGRSREVRIRGQLHRTQDMIQRYRVIGWNEYTSWNSHTRA